MRSQAFIRFRKSMQIGFTEWHEGVGYDLKALARATPEERALAEGMLLPRATQDWRDIQALDQLGTQRALWALRNALDSGNLAVRLEAASRLEGRGLLTAARVEALLLETLPKATAKNGMRHALQCAAAHPSATVRRKLLWCALHGNRDLRGPAAALVQFLYGKSSSAFDPDQREFYARFASNNRAQRKLAYLELCESIGLTASA